MPFTMFVKNKSIFLPTSWGLNTSYCPWLQISSFPLVEKYPCTKYLPGESGRQKHSIQHVKLNLSGSRAQAHRDVSDYVSFTLFPSQTVMSHSFYPPLMQRTSWTLAVPFKEQDHHRGPSDSIGNNYSLTARDMKLKDLLKVYQPATINVPRNKTSQRLPSGTCNNVPYFVQKGASK